MIKKISKLQILGLLLLANYHLQAQVGILTPMAEVSSALEIKSVDKGLLIPRLTTAEKKAIKRPAHSLLVFDTDQNSVSQNIGTEDYPIWDRLTLFNKQSFYMPSITIPTQVVGTNLKIDLFTEYKNQFKQPMFKSNGAPNTIDYYANPTDLYYYITYYDPTIIKVNSFSKEGVLNYTVLKKANYDSYVNIVFVAR